MEIAKTLLQEVGVVVTEAGNGQEAVDMFESSPVNYYHAILMDILMPVKDGYTAAKEIKNLNRPDSVEVPIIAMTANAYNPPRGTIKGNQGAALVLRSGMSGSVPRPIHTTSHKSHNPAPYPLRVHTPHDGSGHYQGPASRL